VANLPARWQVAVPAWLRWKTRGARPTAHPVRVLNPVWGAGLMAVVDLTAVPAAMLTAFGTYPFFVIVTATVFAPAAPASASERSAIAINMSFRISTSLLSGAFRWD